MVLMKKKKSEESVKDLGESLSPDARDKRIAELEAQLVGLNEAIETLQKNAARPAQPTSSGDLRTAIEEHKRESWRVRGKPNHVDLKLYAAAGLK